MKLTFNDGVWSRGAQPPSGGCVLKPAVTMTPIAVGGPSRLQAAVC